MSRRRAAAARALRPGGARQDRGRAARPALLRLLACAALALGGCGGGAAATGSTGPQAAEPAPGGPCNGAAAACGRRLDEVFFPATHNSFAAADEPGWYFASQTYPISRQLDDGVRALLIDVHMGVYDAATGRVRTDLAAEGSDRNKVAEQVPPRALRIADRVAGQVGVGTLTGTSAPYLCHTLCELGAEPLVRELETIRSFMERHPREVLVVIVEDYVPPSVISAAFAQAGLTRLTVTLARHAPPPTLGDLVASGTRLVVFAEQKGGEPSWYMPAFSYIQDTPLGAVRPSQLSCARYRGEPDSPLLLVNYWIPPFPPSPSLNAAIGREPVLRGHLERCLKERGAKGAIVAVDFYERTAAVAVARALNDGGG